MFVLIRVTLEMEKRDNIVPPLTNSIDAIKDLNLMNP
jgi:hypothetical protein